MNDRPASGPGARHLSAVPDPVAVPERAAGALPRPAFEIAAGHAFAGPALDLGALMWEGRCLPDAQVLLPLSSLTRHGLVAGATGTGRTRTLQLLAEQLSAQGVPVLLTDVRGDLSGIAEPGEAGTGVTGRATEVGQRWTGAGRPTAFYGLGADGAGVPVRATVTGLGPLLLARLLGLDAVGEETLARVFRYADAEGLELVGLDDLRAVLTDTGTVGGPGGPGGVPSGAAGAVLRAVSAFEAREAAGALFGAPACAPADFLRLTADGQGLVSVLEPGSARDHPPLWTAFLMWLLAGLYEALPVVGDVGRPRLVLLVDEAEPLFSGASPAFLEAVTRTVRLIRSKGVGIFFVTRAPQDVPADVLGQLGNRVQHALRAFSAEDREALRATVRDFPESAYDLGELLTGLGTGEAVVTVCGEHGAPTPPAAVRLRAPGSRMGPLDPAALRAHAERSAPAPARPRGGGAGNGNGTRAGITRSLFGTATTGHRN
ncbi:helicase HerA-like domain-containing protein [Streptomyces sp. NPDC007088]|uniref:helicase HerA-like domain-containing protein n=1 Tax=Streptomyces sp. NPDC007088 TaxID=3364773 RepID=UPI0036B00191